MQVIKIQAFKQLKVLLILRTLLHTIFKDVYLEPYLRFLETSSLMLKKVPKHAHYLYLTFIYPAIKNVFSNRF